MVSIKYALIGAMVAIGIFAFVKRDFVLDAFHWDPKTENLAIPAFDPVARAKELSSAPPTAHAIRVSKASDTRSAQLPAIQGDADSAAAVSIQGGSATLSGTVTGPSGPVSGATVHIERFVGEQSAAVDLTTNANGAFSLANVPGGRYRIRAWRSPDYAQLGSQVAFVTDGQQQSFALQVVAPSGRDVDVDWTSAGWVIGGTPTISVTVTQPYVTREGQVDLTGSSGLSTSLSVGGALTGGGSGTTNGEGQASFTVRCATVGPATATISVGSYTKSLSVPACSPPPTTTTTTTTTTSTTTAPPPGPSAGAPPGSAPSSTPTTRAG